MPVPFFGRKERDKTELRRHQATAAVGYTAVAGAGVLRDRGLRRINAVLPPKTHRHPEALRLARTIKHKGLGKGRALWAAGTVLGTAGATAATAGTLGMLHQHVTKGFVQEGFQGAYDANRKTYVTHPAYHETHRGLRRAVVVAGVTAGGAGAGQLSRRAVKLGRVAAHPGLHPAIHAAAGTLGGALALPPASKLASHVSHRERRKVTRPSTKASTVEARPSRGADPAAVRRTLADGRVKKDNPDGADMHVPGVLMGTGKRRKPKLKDPQSWSVGKLATGMTPTQQRQQLHRKQRQFALNASATTAGGTSLALAGLGHKKLPESIGSKARKLSKPVGIGAATLGITAGIEGLRVQHHELDAQRKIIASKALVRTPVYRKSFLETRRSAAGILKPVRISAGLVR